MIYQRKRPDRLGPVPGAYQAAFSALYSSPSDPIAEAIARGPGHYRLACPECDKSPRDTALSVTVESSSEAVWYCHRCGFKGTTTKPIPRAIKAKERREAENAVWREGVRNALNGATPKRWPPFTRDLTRSSEFWIITGEQAWELSKRLRGRALCLPPGHPPDAYRWPVAGRRTVIFDTDYRDGITLGEGRDHARDCPVCHTELVHKWARAFALWLIRRWGALRVEVVAGGKLARYVAEVRRAA